MGLFRFHVLERVASLRKVVDALLFKLFAIFELGLAVDFDVENVPIILHSLVHAPKWSTCLRAGTATQLPGLSKSLDF